MLKHARKDSRHVLFLITDGFSNGGDPIPVANELKEQGVTIFTFGIRNGNINELNDMASQPALEYSYILDSFGEFEAMVRRALHQGMFRVHFCINIKLIKLKIKNPTLSYTFHFTAQLLIIISNQLCGSRWLTIILRNFVNCIATGIYI